MLDCKEIGLICLVLFGGAHSLSADEPLLLVGESPATGKFVGTAEDASYLFLVADQTRSIGTRELIRWSAPSINKRRGELVLVDGSRLVLADAWAGQHSWSVAGDTITATTYLLGKLKLQRSQVQAIVLRAPRSQPRRTRFLDDLISGKDESAEIRMINGDRLQGEIMGLDENKSGKREIRLLINASSDSLALSEDQVTAITFGNTSATGRQKEKIVIGLRDGTALVATSLVADTGRLQVRLAGGVELAGADVRDVVYLRSLSAACVYLSDLEASDYQHVPYLDIPWGYRRDRNVLRGRLQAAGRSWDKGIGMHTASRLSYDLEDTAIAGKYRRFLAEIAVDDAAEDDAAAGSGSVVFRVYLKQDGEWQSAFSSPVVRGGDAPLSVMVELGGAEELALLTDFADRGDERDYANWLDARLE